MNHGKRRATLLVGIVLVIAAGAWWLRSNSSKAKQEIQFETAPVVLGTIRQFVTATGTVQPLNTVEVGTQVSGTIQRIFVDFNDHVNKGQLLAELDPTFLQSALAEAEADLASGQSDVAYNQKLYDRNLALGQLVSLEDLETIHHNLIRAKTALVQAQSRVDKAKINLNYASISSPINGIVLDRAVDEGQTVAASLNAPVLFRIANNLNQMQVEADVAEADIGQIVPGLPASFEVDAYPNLSFSGTVSQIRLQPQIISNVVTYTVVIQAQNPDSKLLPGMTANISITTFEAKDTLTVSEQALQFNPSQDWKASASSSQGADPQVKQEIGARVWIKFEGKLKRLPVEVGPSDGVHAQVLAGLDAGQEVVLGVVQASEINSGGSTARSPFMPTRPKRSRN